MFTLPPDYNTIFEQFKPYFTNRIWSHIQLLLIGSLLTPGQRTVTAILRILGLSQEKHFQTYHRVLIRAVWSSLATVPGAVDGPVVKSEFKSLQNAGLECPLFPIRKVQCDSLTFGRSSKVLDRFCLRATMREPERRIERRWSSTRAPREC